MLTPTVVQAFISRLNFLIEYESLAFLERILQIPEVKKKAIESINNVFKLKEISSYYNKVLMKRVCNMQGWKKVSTLIFNSTIVNSITSDPSRKVEELFLRGFNNHCTQDSSPMKTWRNEHGAKLGKDVFALVPYKQ
jgi:hypothetical protein